MKNRNWQFGSMFVWAFGVGIVWDKEVRCLFLPFVLIGWEKIDTTEHEEESY